MVYGPIQPVTNYSYSRSNDNVYTNPEYIRLMMAQQINPTSMISGGNENNYDPFANTGIYGNSQADFYSQLMQASSATPVISPQMELSIFGGLIGKTVTALFNNQTIKGKVEGVYLNGQNVIININGTTFLSNDIKITKIE